MLPNTEATNSAPKLIKFEESNFDDVLIEVFFWTLLIEVAWAKTTEEKTLLYQSFYLSESYEIVFDVPSIVKQYVTKEEAEDLVAKLNAAGGLAVIEEVEEEEKWSRNHLFQIMFFFLNRFSICSLVYDLPL